MTLQPLRCAGLALVVVVAACAGRSAPAATEAPLPTIAFEKYTLPNGLDVILSEDHRLPLVAIDVWYHVGPANEAAGRTGFAHLFEHMMFQGSKHIPEEAHFRFIEAAGGSNFNGTTDFDRTNYFETLPSNQLELGLWLESDRMGFLLDTVDENKFANQQDVVRNERRQSIEAQPYGMASDVLFQTIFPKGHPYYANVMGSHADIQAAKLDDVKSFFKQYYAPNNASLAIAGDIDKATIKPIIEKYFGSLKRGPDVPPVSVTTPPITAERRVVVKDRVRLPRVYMAWITPAFFKPGDADADAAAGILGGGRSSRLYKKLVYEKQIAQSVQVAQASMTLGSVFQIVVTARPDKTVEEIEAAVNEELERFRQGGPDEAETERARNTFETTMVRGLEVLGGFGGVADTLNMFNHYVKDPSYLPKYIDEHRKITPSSIKAFANQYLKPDTRVVVHVVAGEPDLGTPVPTPKAPNVKPGTGSESVNASEPWRATPPKPAAVKAVALAAMPSFKLANGLTVAYQVRPGIGVASASLLVRNGGDSNPPGTPGLANFTAQMLDQGTASRNATRIADDVAQLGASLGTASSKDGSFVTVSALPRNFAAALDIAADVAIRPNFPEEEVTRQRATQQASIVASRQDPSTIAASAATFALYGAIHPYAFNEFGTPASVNAIKRDDLVAFWKRAFVPSNAALLVASPMNEAELRPLVEKAFGGWTGGSPEAPTLPNPRTSDARVIVVDVGATASTTLRVTTIGPARATTDYPSIEVMNTLLGGMFSSRVNLNLRETHGYSYGASSQFLFRKFPGPFWIQTQVRTDATAPAVSEIFKEVRRMGDTAMTPAELALAKDSITLSLPSAFETSGSAVSAQTDLFLYDLGFDYYTKLPAAIAGVSAADAQAAAKKYLDPSKLIVIAVGDKAKNQSGLKGLNLGKMEERAPQ
jgi:zinc protease